MNINEISRFVKGKLSVETEIEITKITNNSKEVEIGTMFIAIKGAVTDGHLYIKNAVSSGASALLLSEKPEIDLGVPYILVDNTYEASLKLAPEFYNYPSKKMKMIGITGTNGKTTSTYMIESILENAGFKPGVIGTIENRYGGKSYNTENTSPDAIHLQGILNDMVEKGVTHCIMEVSSHAIKLNRISGTSFDIVLFTNLSVEHTEFHPDMEDYFETKSRIFAEDPFKKRIAIVNTSDSWGLKMAEVSKIPVSKIGVNETDDDFYAGNIQIGRQMKFFIGGKTLENKIPVSINLSGHFNVINSLGAAVVCLKLGVQSENITQGLLELASVPGRFENVAEDNDFDVVVDYAHTPAGLENLIKAAGEATEKRVITVFGCGGDRSREKRPVMGEIVGKLSDYSVCTSDNPRTEIPMNIINDILPGLSSATENFVVEPDRKKAIGIAIKMAEPGDIVVIAGKGHEDYQIIGRTKIHFDDREIARAFLKEVKNDN